MAANNFGSPAVPFDKLFGSHFQMKEQEKEGEGSQKGQTAKKGD
jgi:hypothetical protein